MPTKEIRNYNEFSMFVISHIVVHAFIKEEEDNVDMVWHFDSEDT